MISNEKNPVEWALLVTELEEAREHPEERTKEMSDSGSIDDSEFAGVIGHVYAHLNRAWNSRNLNHQIPEEDWATFSRFPQDIDPLG